MRKITNLLVILLLFGFSSLSAQDIQVKGTVTSSEDGTPVPGAYVMIKGTQSGSATDVGGNYTVTVPSTATLVFSSIGMKSREIIVGGSSVIDVILDPDIIGMEEVIVVGYTSVRKEANTGAVNVVKSDKLRDVPEVSFDKMISGKMPGVMITSTSGQPGAASQIRVRGISSLTSGNEPLIVVDGTPVMQGDQSYFTNTSNALAAINPNDVESITLLKDASATSIYGSRGANGVLLITTKSGKLGKPKIDFRASYGVSKLANDNGYGAMSPTELLTYMRDAVTNIGADPDDPASGRYHVPTSLISGDMVDWMDEFTKTGQSQNYELTASGGNERTKHYISAGYTDDEGVFHGVDYKKFQLRTNLDQKVSDWLTAGVRLNGAHTISNDVPMQNLYFANPVFGGVIIAPWTPLYNDEGSYNLDIPENGNTNPLANAVYDDQWERQNRFQGSLYLEIKPFKGFTFKTNNSYELTDGEGRRYWSDKSDASADPVATLQVSNSMFTQITTSNTLGYDIKIADKHVLNLMAGQEAQRNDYNSYYIYSPDVNPDIPYPNTGTSSDDQGDYDESTRTLLSFFGIVNYELNNRYFLKFHLRTDGSSRFGQETKWGTFWSVGASWVLTNESFMESMTSLDLFKLRVSYGINGNDNISNYAQWGVYGPREYNSFTGMAPDQLPKPDLAWELNKTYNIGLDFGLLQRITGSLEYYQRTTTDMLLDSPLSRTTGFASIQDNVGEVVNKGYEALVNVNILDGDIRWEAGANVSHNKSEIMSLSGGQTQFINTGNNRIVHKVGESMFMYYLYDYAGVNPVNGEALWYDADGKLTNQYASANRILAGSPEPKFIGGINTSFGWKGLSLDISLEFKTGNKVLIEENRYVNSDGYLWGANQANTALDYWKQPGDVTRNPKPLADNSTFSSGFRSTRWMQDGDYMRIKNLTLGYIIPDAITRKIGIEQLRIYTSAINLYTFHDVDFWDPERGEDGTGFGIYPQTKKIMFGIELSL
ncbi:MAG TPA: TonB-dependent receptor [Bacteroidales bacterium]|nr:TonB-dependent receptor [Bacteroidales bacterium]